ncbi:MAG: FitA-like ribbon-helix-helix domain-containing protein [Longimicrobiales bacterium]
MTIKNLPPELYERLKRRAECNRRSINQEAIALLERALAPESYDAREFVRGARELRARLTAAGFATSVEEIDRLKNEGRE